MPSNSSSSFKTFAVAALSGLFGIWILYHQVQQDAQWRELKSAGQNTVGRLTEATRHRVNLIPMGYSFQIDYEGQSKKFEVSKALFYQHVNSDGKFRVNEKIHIVFLPSRPKVAELPEMLDLWVWWSGGPILNYPFGTVLLLGSVQLFRRRQGMR